MIGVGVCFESGGRKEGRKEVKKVEMKKRTAPVEQTNRLAHPLDSHRLITSHRTKINVLCFMRENILPPFPYLPPLLAVPQFLALSSPRTNRTNPGKNELF